MSFPPVNWSEGTKLNCGIVFGVSSPFSPTGADFFGLRERERERKRERERERGREGESLWGFLLQTLLEPEIKNERIRKNVKKWERCPSKTRTGEEKKGWTTLKNEGRNKEWRWCRTKRDADDVVFFAMFCSFLFCFFYFFSNFDFPPTFL